MVVPGPTLVPFLPMGEPSKSVFFAYLIVDYLFGYDSEMDIAYKRIICAFPFQAAIVYCDIFLLVAILFMYVYLEANTDSMCNALLYAISQCNRYDAIVISEIELADDVVAGVRELELANEEE
ncbi:hypothetical protein Tco_1181340 [Tanacetum coccineum]